MKGGGAPWPEAWARIAEARFFEAHEIFEYLWKAPKTQDQARPGLKALAQICVGLCHLQRGNRKGAAALLARGRSGLSASRTDRRARGRAGLSASGADLPAQDRSAVGATPPVAWPASATGALLHEPAIAALTAWAGALLDAMDRGASAEYILAAGTRPPAEVMPSGLLASAAETAAVTEAASALDAPIPPATSRDRTGLSRGLWYMVLAAVFFSVMSLLVKLAGERLPASQIVLARAVVTFVLSWLILARAGVSPWGTRRGLLFLRGLFGFTALLCFYWSVIHLPLAEATVIQYTNPVFTALLAALILRELLGRREVVSLVFGLLGVLIVARPAALLGFGDAEGLPPLAVGIALTGAILSAGAYVTIRKLGASEHPLVIVFWFPLVALPATLPVVIPVWVWPSAFEWMLLLGVGVSTQIAQVFMTRGLQLERAGPATTVSYLQIVLAATWGLMIFGEIPDVWTFAGAALIVGAALMLRRKRPPP